MVDAAIRNDQHSGCIGSAVAAYALTRSTLEKFKTDIQTMPFLRCYQGHDLHFSIFSKVLLPLPDALLAAKHPPGGISVVTTAPPEHQTSSTSTPAACVQVKQSQRVAREAGCNKTQSLHVDDLFLMIEECLFAVSERSSTSTGT